MYQLIKTLSLVALTFNASTAIAEEISPIRVLPNHSQDASEIIKDLDTELDRGAKCLSALRNGQDFDAMPECAPKNNARPHEPQRR